MKMFNKKSATFLSLIVLTSSFFLSSCMKNDDFVEVIGEATIKVVNTVQGSDAQNLYQNDKKITTVPIAYGEASDYLTVIAGTATNVNFKNNGNSTVTANGLIAPNVGSKYTLFYNVSPSGEGAISGLLNDVNPPAAGKIKVRFLNFGSTFQSTLTIETSTATPLVSDLAYYSGSQYNTIDDNLGLIVKVSGATDVVTIPNSAFQTGKNYSVWFDATNPTTPNYHVILEN